MSTLYSGNPQVCRDGPERGHADIVQKEEAQLGREVLGGDPRVGEQAVEAHRVHNDLAAPGLHAVVRRGQRGNDESPVHRRVVAGGGGGSQARAPVRPGPPSAPPLKPHWGGVSSRDYTRMHYTVIPFIGMQAPGGDLVGAVVACGLDQRAVERAIEDTVRPRGLAHLGFGCTVVSEIEVPNILHVMNLG